MALICTLAQYGNSLGTAGKDKITLKVEVESPLQISRSPLVIPLPGGSIVGFDMGRNSANISISGVVDYALTELFIKAPITGTFVVGDIIKTTPASGVAWNAATSPVRAVTPYATVVAGYPSLAAPTSLIISGVYATGSSPATGSFFVDNEPITATTGSGATAVVNAPFPTKRRLEHVGRYWWSYSLTEHMTLTTRSGNYTVLLSGMDFSMQAGIEDRYAFKMAFAQSIQDLI